MVIASFSNYPDIRASADVVDEVSDSLMYMGIAGPGTTSVEDPTWSVCRVQKAGSILTITWADGQCLFNKAFADRADLNYTFRKF
ncbi:MAG: hypothetical protein WCO63_01340 [Bacteroidota bacterium]